MVAPPLPQFPGVPDDLIAAIAVEAERDAHRVIPFLEALGIHASPERPVYWPASFLVELGAALRLLEWERHGLTIHRDIGLPTAKQAVADAFRLLQDAPGDGPCLARRVMVLFADRFAWHGRRDWDAAVVLDSLDDDQALDALAAVLWDHRHDGTDCRSRPLRGPS